MNVGLSKLRRFTQIRVFLQFIAFPTHWCYVQISRELPEERRWEGRNKEELNLPSATLATVTCFPFKLSQLLSFSHTPF